MMNLTFGLAIKPTKHNALWPAKRCCLCCLDALVNTSVFCADLRFQFGGETIAGLSTASYKQWDIRPLELLFWPGTNENVHHCIHVVNRCHLYPLCCLSLILAFQTECTAQDQPFFGGERVRDQSQWQIGCQSLQSLCQGEELLFLFVCLWVCLLDLVMIRITILLPLQNFCPGWYLAIFFFFSDQGRPAALTSTIRLFIGYLENAKYPPDKNCVSCSRHKIVGKLAYLGVKMTSLVQEHKNVVKVAYLSVSELLLVQR